MSFISVNDSRKVPNASEIDTTTKNPMHEIATHSKRKATAYAIGEFVLNGKLSYRKKTDVMISQQSINLSTYKAGNGKSKASLPEPMVKNMNKLKTNFGSITDGSTIFIVIKFIALLNSSISLLVLAYVALDSGYGIPEDA